MQFSTIAAILALAATGMTAAVPQKRSPDGTCPEIHPEDPTTFLADTNDCNVFYICDYSGPVKFNCPTGLYFNPTYWICDWPASSGCVPK